MIFDEAEIEVGHEAVENKFIFGAEEDAHFGVVFLKVLKLKLDTTTSHGDESGGVFGDFSGVNRIGYGGGEGEGDNENS